MQSRAYLGGSPPTLGAGLFQWGHESNRRLPVVAAGLNAVDTDEEGNQDGHGHGHKKQGTFMGVYLPVIVSRSSCSGRRIALYSNT